MADIQCSCCVPRRLETDQSDGIPFDVSDVEPYVLLPEYFTVPAEDWSDA